MSQELDQHLKEIFVDMWNLNDVNGEALQEMFQAFFVDMEDLQQLEPGTGLQLATRVRDIIVAAISKS